METYSGRRGVLFEPPTAPHKLFDHLNFNRSIAVVDREAIRESKLLCYPHHLPIFSVEEALITLAVSTRVLITLGLLLALFKKYFWSCLL
jgi:hypothetical protein